MAQSRLMLQQEQGKLCIDSETRVTVDQKEGISIATMLTESNGEVLY